MAISTHDARRYLEHPVFNAIQRQVLRYILDAIDSMSGIIAQNNPSPQDVLSWDGTGLLWVPALDLAASDLISEDANNAIILGADQLLYVGVPTVDSFNVNAGGELEITVSGSNGAVSIADFISQDAGNSLLIGGNDPRLFVPPLGDIISAINITADGDIEITTDQGSHGVAIADMVSAEPNNRLVVDGIPNPGEGRLFVPDVVPSELVSSDGGNSLTTGGDGGLYVQAGDTITGFNVTVNGDIELQTDQGTSDVAIADMVSAEPGNILTVDDVPNPGEGRLYVPAPDIASGTYTPIVVVVSGASGGASPQSAQWLRTGNIVTVSGSIAVTSNGAFEIRVDPPIASNFSSETQCAGTGASQFQPEVLAIYGDTTFANKAPLLTYNGTFDGLQNWFYTYTYRIV